MPDPEVIEIVPKGEEQHHSRGRYCPCNPIVEPGETPSVTHRSVTPGDNTRPVRRG